MFWDYGFRNFVFCKFELFKILKFGNFENFEISKLRRWAPGNYDGSLFVVDRRTNETNQLMTYSNDRMMRSYR